MAIPHLSILVLADMVEEFDRKEPRPGNETTAFIKRWQAKEMELEHRSAHHMQVAVTGINVKEIQNIRETKKYRDEQRECKRGQHAKVLVDCAEVT